MSFNKTDNKYHGYIYIITNSVNNKVYIGQTRRTVNIRWKQHINSLYRKEDSNTILYRAMKKYGTECFRVQLLKEYSSYSKDELIDELNKEEIRYISEYNSINPYGYNMQEGGRLISNCLKKQVDKYDLDGNYICSYESVSAASLDVGKPNANHSHISECCKGELHSAYGFIWRYKGDPIGNIRKDKRTRKVSVYSLNNEYINTYNTIKEAIIDILGIDYVHKNSHISSCCKNKRKYAYGYIWKYAD